MKLLSAFDKPQFINKSLGLETGTLNLLCGEGSAGKSMFAQYLLACFAANLPLFGVMPFSMTGKVLHIDQEMSSIQTWKRYARILYSLGVSKDLPITRIKLEEKIEDKARKIMKEFFIALFRGFELVLIDSLKRITTRDENSSDMAYPLQLLKECAEEVGCTIIIIHHKGKSKTTATQTGRGSSAIYDGVDAQLDMDYNRDSKLRTLRWTKVRDNDDQREVLTCRMFDNGRMVEEHNKTMGLSFELIGEREILIKNALDKIVKHLSIASLKDGELYNKVKGDKDIYHEALDSGKQSNLIIDRHPDKRTTLWTMKVAI